MDSAHLSFELCNLDYSFGHSMYSFEWNAYFGIEKNESGERGERRIYCGPYARSEPKVVRILWVEKIPTPLLIVCTFGFLY